MDVQDLFHIGELRVTLAMVIFAGAFLGGVIKCWSRGGMDAEWDTPTRLRYQADAGRIMRDWFLGGALALGALAVVLSEPFVGLQCLGLLAGAYVAGKKQMILEQQALEVQAFLDGTGGPQLLAAAGLPPDLLAELGIDPDDLDDEDLVRDDRRLDWGGGR